jgi:hypothetical protein
MSDSTLVKTGAVGAGVAAICCATPITAVTLAALGLGAFAAQADYVLIPALFGFIGLAGYGLYRRSTGAAKRAIVESVITCPKCGFAKSETMPTDACQFFYECTNCGERLKPKAGDCCVFCSYGSVPCPPIQAVRSGQPGAAACCP